MSPATPHEMTLPVDGGALALDRYGDRGTPVVCVPGLGDLRSSYRALAPTLAAAGHVVYVMDLRGHGASTTGFATHAAHDIGADIVALLEHEDLRGAVLVGNSIGGGAIAWAAAEAPQRVDRLVMLNPFVRDMPVERWMRPLVPLLFARPWGTRAWGLYRKTLFVTAPEDQPANQAEVLQNLAAPARLAAVRAMLRASKAPVAARLAEVTEPTLVVMGANDPDYPDPVAEGRTLTELLPGPTTVEVLDACGHYPQIEHPEATASAILSFLAEPQEDRRGA